MTNQQPEGPASPSRDIIWPSTQDPAIEEADFKLDQNPEYPNIANYCNRLDWQPQRDDTYVQWSELFHLQTQQVYSELLYVQCIIDQI
jgi:hypothetical protein